MYRYTEEDKAIIAAARKANKDKRAEKRLYALELRAAGKSAGEVASATGFHAAYISQLTAKYRTGGIEAISGNHYGGNHRNMAEEEEAALLEPYREKAEQGQIVEVSEGRNRSDIRKSLRWKPAKYDTGRRNGFIGAISRESQKGTDRGSI